MKQPTTPAVPLPDGLSSKKLRATTAPKSLGFKTTAELQTEPRLIGQDRAIDAIRLSAGISHKDFNLYVLGPQGMGRHSAVLKLLGEQAIHRPVPSDWVYVNNFEVAHKPNAIELAAGSAARLKTAMQDLVDDLANEIPALFESDEYQTQRRTIEEEFGERHEEPIAEFADRAKAENVALLRTPMGFILTEVVDGKPIKPEEFEALDPARKKEIEEKIEALQESLAVILRQAPQLQKEHRQRIEKLHAAMAERVVSVRLREMLDKFRNNAGVMEYLEQVRLDMISNAELFLLPENGGNNGTFPKTIRKFHREPQFQRYAVNIMVSHDPTATAAAPIVTEDLPTLNHLTGRIEHVSEMGTLSTNFTLIKAGALHRANGGYLVLDVRQVLNEPYAWDTLKRCLYSQSIAITSLADRLSVGSTTSLEPDPIPLDVRVVLIGDRRLHMLLTMLDPDFGELFKLQADFEDDLLRSVKNTKQFARVIAAHAQKDGLRPMNATAVARLLDHAVRMADDTKKLSLQMGALADVMREADHYATQANTKVMTEAEVSRAILEADRRASRIKDRMQEAITRKTILVDTSGEAIGQVNGLSVIGIGQHYFGRPSRITARVRIGAGKLIDIEREVELGGPLHSKGVMILGGYLSSTYALDAPMSLHASLVFEQSYGGVDGDSASSAELYALLSALSEVPIRQGLAVTGSVNQMGEVQAIGGVNEKIEGFFDICKARKLTGTQGVLIPAANVDHLMLRPDVVEAAKVGQFRVIPIKTINEGIEVLTGYKAGKRRSNGDFLPDTINALVEEKLRSFARVRKAFAAKPDQGGQPDGGEQHV